MTSEADIKALLEEAAAGRQYVHASSPFAKIRTIIELTTRLQSAEAALAGVRGLVEAVPASDEALEAMARAFDPENWEMSLTNEDAFEDAEDWRAHQIAAMRKALEALSSFRDAFRRGEGEDSSRRVPPSASLPAGGKPTEGAAHVERLLASLRETLEHSAQCFLNHYGHESEPVEPQFIQEAREAVSKAEAWMPLPDPPAAGHDISAVAQDEGQ